MQQASPLEKRKVLSPPVKIGVVGGGMIAQVGHLPFYLGDKRCEVVRVAESRPSLVSSLIRQLGPGRIVTDHHSLLNDREIQAVVISVPREATAPLTLAALEASKHVMAEKPMAHSVEQASKLVVAARSRALVYAVGFMKRYDPGVEAAKSVFENAVADGRIGRFIMARFYNYSNSYAVVPPPHTRPHESRIARFPSWPLYPEWLPNQYHSFYAWFANVAIHDLNLLNYFFPSGLEVLSAWRHENSTILAMLRMDDVPIALEITKSTLGRWAEGAEFVFERGSIRLFLPSPMAQESVSKVLIDDESNGLFNHCLKVGSGWSFARQASGFLDSLTGRARPATSGSDAIADMVLMEKLWQKIIE